MSTPVALITGASKGLGAAIATRLSRDGFTVVLTARDTALLDALAARLRTDGGAALVVSGDLREPATAPRLIEAALSAFGRLDLLVNNAGATKRGRFPDLTEADWAEGFALKFFGAVRLTRAAWPHLKAARGSVIHIAGIGGRTPGPEFAIGGSVNAALLSFTKALADLGLEDGIRVNCVNPGRIKTDRLTTRLRVFAEEQNLPEPEAEKLMLQQAGIPRFGEPHEVAALVSYLASPAGSFFQGALIDLDGGETKSL